MGLKEDFLESFGLINKNKTHETSAMRVGNKEWSFTLRKVNSTDDAVWILQHSSLHGVTGSIPNQISNDLLISRATVALAISRVNGVPVFQSFAADKFKPEDLVGIDDLDYPPVRVRYIAAEEVLSVIKALDEHSIVDFLQGEYDTAFPGDDILYPGDNEVQQPKTFVCIECLHEMHVSGEDLQNPRVKEKLENDEGLSCHLCGSTCKPKGDGDDKEGDSPLG